MAEPKEISGDDHEVTLSPFGFAVKPPQRRFVYAQGRSASERSSISKETIGLRRHDEVVPVQPVDLVGPPLDRNLAPLSDDQRMMILGLGFLADTIREVKGVRKIRELEGALETLDAIDLFDTPLLKLWLEVGNLCVR